MRRAALMIGVFASALACDGSRRTPRGNSGRTAARSVQDGSTADALSMSMPDGADGGTQGNDDSGRADPRDATGPGDSGVVPPFDGGTIVRDAGVWPDAVVPVRDSGTWPPHDSGVSPPRDAGGYPGLSGGYLRSCTSHGDCPSGMECLRIQTTFCTPTCTDNQDCAMLPTGGTGFGSFCIDGHCLLYCSTRDGVPCPAPLVCPDLTGTGAGACIPP